MNLQKIGRRIQKVYIAGTTKHELADLADIDFGTCQCGDEPRDYNGLELSDYEEQCGIYVVERTSEENDVIYGSESGQNNSRQQGKYVQRQLLGEKASAKILEWAPQSILKFKTHPLFKTTFPELYWNKSLFDKVVTDVAWDDAVKEWNQYSFQDIITKRKNNLNSFLNYDKQYYAPEYSANLIARLILEQSNSSPTDSINFIDNLINVMDKNFPKINSFVIKSPPSSGKTFLFDTIEDLCNPSTGHIRNVTKFSDPFTYQDAVNKRVAFWNECIITGKEPIETAKEIWEGKPKAVNVKYSKGQKLQRTPLLVSGNSWPWKHDPTEAKAFKDRSIIYEWRPQPWLKNVSFYPCGVGWDIILREYKNDSFWLNLPPIEEFNDKTDKIILDPGSVYLDVYLSNQGLIPTLDNNEILSYVL